MDIQRLKELPDSERAKRNLETFIVQNPGYEERLEHHFTEIATLFSYSQFLANFSTKYPDLLFKAIDNRNKILNGEEIKEELKIKLTSAESLKEGMDILRILRKYYFLTITLQDILKIFPIQVVMLHLSTLADSILSVSLDLIEDSLKKRYGEPEDNSVSIIALGKLGAEELNYSSDIDIIFVYKKEGETSGIKTVSGITVNKISAFEYYTKLVEELNRFLSLNTENGFVFRVDLRLRPQGQRGSLALSLSSYEEYYESWGQLWERAALIRARPVAGDRELGLQFLKTIEPFVFRKYLDFDSVDEIRRLKSQVEQIKGSSFSRDIKRGYGGIREIEFFIQVFQLIYGGKYPILRERSTFKALHKLLQKGFIGYEDYYQLTENYIFLRTIEHRLQQLNDIQTHTIPSNEEDLNILSKKMGFDSADRFLEELGLRRKKVRSIYDSLLEAKKTELELGLFSSVFWDMDSPVNELITEELKKTKIKDIPKTIHHLMKIRSNMYSFQTIKGRRLLEKILSNFVDKALKGENPEIALSNLVDFSSILATKESYLEALSDRMELISLFNFIFCQSEYLSKMIMSSPEFLESIVEKQIKKKSLLMLNNEINLFLRRYGESKAIRLFKKFEEMRLGILFLNKELSVERLMKSLTKVADTILSLLQKRYAKELNIIAFGKLGGREIIFNSDIDIIFITEDYPDESTIKGAEQILRTCMSYTIDGIAYKIDTRLRPDGSKGPLINSLEGIRQYYLKNAQIWEIQALLKARPIYKEEKRYKVQKGFIELRKEILLKKGEEITINDIKKMRNKIKKELSKETDRIYDIKLGEGGLEELEFIIQYLQLKNCKKYPELLVQGTLDGINRLRKANILSESEAEIFKETYLFYRIIEILLRLRNETLLKEKSPVISSISSFLKIGEQDFLGLLREKKNLLSGFLEKLS
jgi:glutamate-ammonia-ligase adenylyltransferase